MAKQDQRGQLDAYELAVLRGAGDDNATEDGHPPRLRPLQVGKFKVGSLGLLGGFFVLVLLVSVSRLGGSAPGIPANCTSYGLKLPTSPVTEHAPVAWSAAGPDGDVVLALDATSLDIASLDTASLGAASLGADPTAVAAAGRTAQVLPAIRLSGCAGSGVFGIQLPAGTHTATLFRLTPGSPAVAVASHRLVVVTRQGGPAPIG